MIFLILAHVDDPTALRTAAVLRRRHEWQAVRILSADGLAMAPRVTFHQEIDPLSHALDSRFEIELAGRSPLRSSEIGVVFNRLRQAEAPHFAAASPEDREYAAAELSALWVSWLASLRAAGVAVINPAGSRGLQPNYSRLEWLEMAVRAGFSICNLGWDSAGLPALTPDACGVNSRWLAAGSQLHRWDAGYASLDGSHTFRIRTERRGAYAPFPDADFPARVRRLQALSECALLELSFLLPADPTEAYRLAAVDAFPHIAHPHGVELIAQMLEAAR